MADKSTLVLKKRALEKLFAEKEVVTKDEMKKALNISSDYYLRSILSAMRLLGFNIQHTSCYTLKQEDEEPEEAEPTEAELEEAEEELEEMEGEQEEV